MKNRFNPYSWEAEIYKTPKEIYAALDSFGIYGKAIDRVTVIGMWIKNSLSKKTLAWL